MSSVYRLLSSRLDYLRYVATREWLLGLAALGLFLTVAAWVMPVWAARAIGVACLLLAAVAFGHDVLRLRRQWASWSFRRVPSDYHGPEDCMPITYGPCRLVRGPCGGTAAVSDEVDALLGGADLRFDWRTVPYRLPSRLWATAPYVLRRQRRGGSLIFNGELVRLDTDPVPALLLVGGDLIFRPVRFFDGECSNELYHWRISRQDGQTEFHFAEEYLLDSRERILTLADSELANAVGISTLAVTADDHVVIVLQSERTSASQDLYAPSGSGSLEARDVGVARDEPVQKVLARAMERELREECDLPPKVILGSVVVGFARWMERGAKPEFFGLTALSVTSKDLRSRPRRSEERLWTQGVRCVAVGALPGPSVDVESAVSALLPEQDVIESASLPLSLNLRAVVRALQRDPAMIDRIRRSPSEEFRV